MSSKDKKKVGSAYGERDRSVTKDSHKTREKETQQIDGDKSASRHEKTSKKHIDENNKSNLREMSGQTKIIDDDNVYEKEERRRKKEKKGDVSDKTKLDRGGHSEKKIEPKEIINLDKNNESQQTNKRDEKRLRKAKDDLKDNDKTDKDGSRRRTEKDESVIRQSTVKEMSKVGHRGDKEDSVAKNKVNKEGSSSRHKRDSDVYDKIDSKHREDRNDLNVKPRSDKDESNRRHRRDKAESESRHNGDRGDSINKHKSEKDSENSKNKETDRQKNKIFKDNTVMDARGDKIVQHSDTLRSQSKDLSVKPSELKVHDKFGSMDYDEDFDEYNEDDFEDINSSSTIASINKGSIDNSSLSASPKEVIKPTTANKSVSKVQSKNQEGIHTSFINFGMAQKKCCHDAIANSMLSRAYDLSRLIDLDKSHYDILDVPPVLEHSQYMLLFGRAGCQHVSSQTRDDNMERECQTEVIDERTVWTQQPPLDDEGCARVMSDTSQANLGSLLTNVSSKTALQMLTESGVSSSPLIQILNLMDRVLEEESSPEVATKISSTQNGQQIMSLGYTKYSREGVLCTLGTFCSANSGIFATVHRQTRQSGDERGESNQSSISIWRVSSNNREPQRCLSSPRHNAKKSDITSVTFSPDAASSHVIGGLDSGLIALWDLRERATSTDSGSGDPPAYITAIMGDGVDRSHQGPVIGLHASCTEGASSSYQLLSLDTGGSLSIWIINSLMQSGLWAVVSGSLADLNLRPGSRCRMNIVATVSLFSGPGCLPSSVTCMAVDAVNPAQIFAGTQDGHVVHVERSAPRSSSGRNPPRGRLYGSSGGYESAIVTKLDVYPFYEPYLLAGYDDGSLRLFLIGRVEPLLSFSDKRRNPIIECKWSKNHPAVFFSLDSGGNLNIWNVLVSVYRPLLTQTLPGYIGFDLSADSRWQPKEDKSVNNRARLLMWSLDGSIEVHELHSSFVVAELDDCFKTCSLFQSLL